MSEDIQDRLTRQETRVLMLEEGQRGILTTLTSIQAEAARSRGEQMKALDGLSVQVSTLIKQADVRAGVELATKEHSAANERRNQTTGLWLRWLLPITIVIALFAATEWLDQAGYQRTTIQVEKPRP